MYKNYTVNDNKTFGWAEYFLPIVNVQKDIETIDNYVKDCIRATQTKCKKVGGIGSVNDRLDYTVTRGIGKNVKSNRYKTDVIIDGYISMVDMWKTINTDKELFKLKARLL